MRVKFKLLRNIFNLMRKGRIMIEKRLMRIYFGEKGLLILLYNPIGNGTREVCLGV
jgi:hypothetical protein